MTDGQTKTRMQDLWDRRFFQFVGTYLGVSFGIIQFAEFLESRFALEIQLVERLLVFFVILLPAAVVFIYNHGRKGDDEWKPIEKVLIPASFALGLGASLFLVRAEASTEDVMITTESGDTITRTIPAARLTKRILVLPFVVPEEQKVERQWLGVAASYLTGLDLEQDMRIITADPFNLESLYEAYKYPYLADLPFATQLKFAQDQYHDFFVTGALNEADGGLELRAKVFHGDNGREFFDETLVDEDIYGLVDQLSSSLREAIYLKEGPGSLEITDLPSADLVTGSTEALRPFVEANILSNADVSQLPAAIAQAQEAVKLDDKCAECHISLSIMHFGVGQKDRAQEHAKKALDQASSLPERQRFFMRYYNYLLHDDIQKALVLLESWRKLYPNDYNPYQHLITVYRLIQEVDKAKAVAKAAIDKGHRGTVLTTLAELYLTTDDFDEAERYMREYAEFYPHMAEENSKLGELYLAKGDLQQALEFYERMTIVHAEEVKFFTALAGTLDRMGRFEQAAATLEEALALCDLPRDSMQVFTGMETHLERLGRFEESFAANDRKKRLWKKLAPAAVVEPQTFFTQLPKYLINGKDEAYRNGLDSLKSILPQRAGIFDCVSHFMYVLVHRDSSGLRGIDPVCEDLIIRSSGDNFDLAFEGIQHRLHGNYPKAAKYYEAYIDSTGVADKQFSVELSEVYRHSGQLDKAEALVDDLLKIDPNQPIYLLEKARVAHAQQDLEQAGKYLKNALDVWHAADSSYRHYQEALDLQELLK